MVMDRVSAQAATLTAQLAAFSDLSEVEINSLDAEARRKLSETAKQFSIALEAPGDSVHRILHSTLQLPLTVVGVDTKLFEILSDQDGSQTTVSALAEKTKIDGVLLKRLLRYYQSFGMISQLGNDAYAANNVTKALATLAGRAGAPFNLYTMTPPYNALPKFLRDTGYANITDPSNCPWYPGQNTHEPPFTWMQTHPPQLELFMGWMESQRDGLPIFLDKIDFQKEFGQCATESTVLFVDIGGAMGHQSIALKQKYPQLPGRILLQDQQGVIDQIRDHPLPGFTGIEAQPYDFFTPQPVKGARAYYLRNILHDWPTHKCVEILRNIKVGMTSESRILIDEMVLPEYHASWRATQLDFAMASCYAAMERSKEDWDALLEEAGLQIEKIWKYTEQLDDCVIVAVPK